MSNEFFNVFGTDAAPNTPGLRLLRLSTMTTPSGRPMCAGAAAVGPGAVEIAVDQREAAAGLAREVDVGADDEVDVWRPSAARLPPARRP